MARILTLLIASCLPLSALATPTIKLESIRYSGSGCPKNTAHAVVSPDGKALSILFDDFNTQAGRPTSKLMDQELCVIRIPVKVPRGYSISFFNVDYRGYNYLPHGGQTRFSIGYSWGEKRGPKFAQTFQGPLDQNFIFSSELSAENENWSPCGKKMDLQIHATIHTQSNRENEEAFSSIDSADIESGLIYRIRWKRCS